MKSQTSPTFETNATKSLAAEDLRCGDFVSILYEVTEYPSCFWCGDSRLMPADEPVRVPYRTADCGTPLKVKAICLPFVFVKKPCGAHRTLDLRQHTLVRLTPDYARQVWKTMSKAARRSKLGTLQNLL
jgi:hypothetical protein